MKDAIGQQTCYMTAIIIVEHSTMYIGKYIHYNHCQIIKYVCASILYLHSMHYI